WFHFDERAVDGSGGGSKTPVNGMRGELLLAFGQAVTGDLLGENNGRRRLAVDAGRKHFLGEDFGAGAGESSDHSGKCALEDGAFAGGGSFGHANEMREKQLNK